MTYVHLEEMYSVTDDIIIALGNLKKLDCLALENLNRITNRGIQGLLDKIDQNTLVKLTINKCPNISDDCIVNAKQKIKVVEHI